MQRMRGHDKSPGEFRTIQNQTGQNARYVPPPPAELDRLLGNFDNFINLKRPSFDPLVDCFIAHYQFEAIHPFVDGNGRLGRSLLRLMIRGRLRHTHPWLYMSAYFEQYRDDYMRHLFRTSTHGDWKSWIEFCLHGAISQARDAVARCLHFNQAYKKYQFLVTKPSRRTYALIEQLFRSPVLSVSWVAEHMNVSYPTAKRDVEKLVEAGILQEIEGARQKTFMAAELVRLAYSPVPPHSSFAPAVPQVPEFQ